MFLLPSFFCNNYVTAESIKEINNQESLNQLFSFYFINPENNTIYEEEPKLKYYISPVSASIQFYINGTEYNNLINETELPVEYRGTYNLTGLAEYNENKIVSTIFFSFFPLISMEIVHNASYETNFVIPYGYNESFIPCYSLNEQITLFASFNERNSTLEIEIKYFYSNEKYSLTNENFSWIDDLTVKIMIEPVSINSTMHRLLFKFTSTLPQTNFNKTFWFYRAVLPLYIEPHFYENFISQPLSGIATGHFNVIYGISYLINISVYLDGTLILYEYDPEGIVDYLGYITVTIDTTKYEDGNHSLTIIVKDYFNITASETYILTFRNTLQPTNNTTENPINLLYFILCLISLAVVSKYLHKGMKDTQ